MLSEYSELTYPPNGLTNVRQISPAINETFVILCQGFKVSGCLRHLFSVLLHVDKNNRTIKRYDLIISIKNFVMTSPQ